MIILMAIGPTGEAGKQAWERLFKAYVSARSIPRGRTRLVPSTRADDVEAALRTVAMTIDEVIETGGVDEGRLQECLLLLLLARDFAASLPDDFPKAEMSEALEALRLAKKL